MTTILQRVRDYFVPPRISDVAGLQQLVGREATHIAQKVMIDYCEARTNMYAAQLFSERPFIEVLNAGIARSWPAVLGDAVIVAEHHLRPAAGLQAVAAADALQRLYGRVLNGGDGPALDGAARDEAEREFEMRFSAARAQPTRSAADVAAFSGERLFRSLPLHRRYTSDDQDAVTATVQFRMTVFRDELARRLDPPAVIAELVRAD
jgi:hypothetical protein